VSCASIVKTGTNFQEKKIPAGI